MTNNIAQLHTKDILPFTTPLSPTSDSYLSNSQFPLIISNVTERRPWMACK